jgi:hypothetical protein
MVGEAEARPLVPARVRFTIANGSAQVQSVSVKISDLDMSPEGFPSAAPEPRERGASRWLQLERTTLDLAAGETRTVQGTIRAPRDANGTYGAILEWSFSAGEGESRPRSLFNTVLLVTVHGRGRAAPALVIEGLDVLPPAGEQNGWQVRLRVKNAGNLHTRVAGSATLRRLGGAVVGQTPLRSGQGLVFPGTVRHLTGVISAPLEDGPYFALAETYADPGGRGPSHVGFFLVRGGRVEAKPPDERILRELAALLPPISVQAKVVQTSLRPGGRRVVPVRVTNHTQERLTVTARLRPTAELGGRGDQLGRCRPGCFSVPPRTLELSPQRSGAIGVTVALPRDATGEVCAVLEIVASLPGGSQSAYATDVLVLVTAQGTERVALEVDHLAVTAPGTREASYEVSVRNAGNVSVQPTVRISVLDSAGDEVDRLSFEVDGLLRPGELRAYTLPCSRPLAPGTYTLRARATTATGEAAVTDIRFDVAGR